jgi:hypothetical protein
VIGPILVVVAIVIAIPMGLMVSGAVASMLLGWTLQEDIAERYEGSELIEHNR